MIAVGTPEGDKPIRRPEPRATALLAERPDLRGISPVADAVDQGDRG